MNESDLIALRLGYLNITQEVISRLANSVAVTKGASITVLGAMLAFAASDKANEFSWWFFLPPGMIFMFFDSYFLQRERVFRKLYNRAASKPLEEVVSLVIDTKVVQEVKEDFFSVLIRKSIFRFHVPLNFAVVLAYCLS
ncbi:hypothetical protein DUD43_09065 [Alcaligenes faecalis]|uniref:hypothetical protein n=1 Tax=Alcaligenes faecalis TaxID=511 RepID=UPI001293C685|nr:hypothetical protein [Alcaligenes faecalis]QFY77820.1 hypothetical protein DUD43_09065 [Alcaligenes faecalis]